MTRSFLGLSAGARLESDDSDDELFAKALDINATTGQRRRARSEPRPTQPAASLSPGPPSRRTSLPDLRELTEAPPPTPLELRRSSSPTSVGLATVETTTALRRSSSPTSVGLATVETTTAAAIEESRPRDVNGNHTEEKPNLAVRLQDIKPRFRVVEPPKRDLGLDSANCEVMLRVQGGRVVSHRQEGDDFETTAAVAGVAYNAVADYLRDQQPPPKRRCQHRPIQVKVEWPMITLKGDEEQTEYVEPDLPDLLEPKKEPSSGEEEGQ